MEPARETNLSPLTKILTFAAAVELFAGLALMIDPAIVATLLLGEDLPGAGTLVGRLFGIAIFALGLACWPPRLRAESSSPAFRAMLVYNALIASCLFYVGAVGSVSGLMLWPAVALHGAVALLLLWTWRAKRRIMATNT
jgi:hypothetical protein